MTAIKIWYLDSLIYDGTTEFIAATGGPGPFNLYELTVRLNERLSHIHLGYGDFDIHQPMKYTIQVEDFEKAICCLYNYRNKFDEHEYDFGGNTFGYFNEVEQES